MKKNCSAKLAKKVVTKDGFEKINAIRPVIKAIRGRTGKFKFGLKANWGGLVKELGFLFVSNAFFTPTLQKAMATLFDVNVPAISKHLKNIFESGELKADSVVSKMEITASDGKNYQTQFYSLDAIIAVGYRVNSVRATQFRQWATSVLKVYAIRGYVLDRKRMENGTFLDEDYFEHLLAEIREIRLSERRFYQKLTDIYADKNILF